jgi:hypothetical protein
MKAAKPRREAAAALFAVHFARYTEAAMSGQPLPEPDQTKGTDDDIMNALGTMAHILDLKTGQQRQALVQLIGGFAEMIALQGAELEGTLHTVLNPDDPMRKAMVMRIKTPTVR